MSARPKPVPREAATIKTGFATTSIMAMALMTTLLEMISPMRSPNMINRPMMPQKIIRARPSALPMDVDFAATSLAIFSVFVATFLPAASAFSPKFLADSLIESMLTGSPRISSFSEVVVASGAQIQTTI